MSGLTIALIIALAYTWGGVIISCINIGDCVGATGKDLFLTVLLWGFTPIIKIVIKKKREREDRTKWMQ